MHGARPATKNDWLEHRQLYHEACDGELNRYGEVTSCRRCGRRWKNHFLGGLDSQQLGYRFVVKTISEWGQWTLVEKTEGQTRFTTVVPNAEASKYEKCNV